MWYNTRVSSGISERNAHMSNQIEVTLPNGVKLAGKLEDVVATAKALGHQLNLGSEFYLSSSQGYVRIREMGTEHIRNAMLKYYREWASNLSTKSGRDLLGLMEQGPDNPTFNALLREYATRVM